MSATTDQIVAAIIANVLGPKKVRGDQGEIEQHSLKDQLEALKELEGDEGMNQTGLGLRFRRFKNPGAE